MSGARINTPMAASELFGKSIAFALVVCVAFFVNEMPTSGVLQSLLPDWPFLVVLFFSVSERWRATVIFAFIVGLLQDQFIGTPLGVHAFVFTLCAYIISQYRKRFRYAGMMFQTMIVGLLVLLKVILVLIVNSFMYSLPGYFWSLLSVPLSMFAWVILTWLGLMLGKSEAN